MTVNSTATHSDAPTSLATIHGYRVQSYGRRITSGLKKGLIRLAERGFHDPSCVVVYTGHRKQCAITHTGGRYAHPVGTNTNELMQDMRQMGMEPPSPPFLLTPGEATLYHEWGHHVDYVWSGDDQDVEFSYRWFSRYYHVGLLDAHVCHAGRHSHADKGTLRSAESVIDVAKVLVAWNSASSELFASLFEDWMRGDKRVGWDECDPNNLKSIALKVDPSVRIALLPGVSVDVVRAETYRLFPRGIRGAVDRPPVQLSLFGENTDKFVSRMRTVRCDLRAKHLPTTTAGAFPNASGIATTDAVIGK